MNILLIGNGFDLAHHLPTKYSNFLDFCKIVEEIYNPDATGEDIKKNIKDWNINSSIAEKLLSAFKERKIELNHNKDSECVQNVSKSDIYLDELYKCINKNAWIKFFCSESTCTTENWIDFESEISNVIQELDKLRSIIIKTKFNIKQLAEYRLVASIIKGISPKYVLSDVNSMDKLILHLYNDLNKLIRTLEIYLSVFVGKIECNIISPDIKELHFDKILSFNYTDTFRKIYDTDGYSDYDYIHGFANCDSTINTNNMVLGIDEYLSEEKMNTEMEFIVFKKFYQRVYKGTGLKYREWVDDIKSNIDASIDTEKGKSYTCESSTYHYLYIFGHSLDITDKDVLSNLILNDNVKTIIFYNKANESDGDDNGRKSLGEKITNLVKIIGQEELIRRTGGKKRTIEFKLQQDMISTE